MGECTSEKKLMFYLLTQVIFTICALASDTEIETEDPPVKGDTVKGAFKVTKDLDDTVRQAIKDQINIRECKNIQKGECDPTDKDEPCKVCKMDDASHNCENSSPYGPFVLTDPLSFKMVQSSVTLPNDQVKIAKRLKAERRANYGGEDEDDDDDEQKGNKRRKKEEKKVEFDSNDEEIKPGKTAKFFRGLKSGTKKLAIGTYKTSKSLAYRLNEHSKSDSLLCIVVDVKKVEMENRKKDLADRKKLMENLGLTPDMSIVNNDGINMVSDEERKKNATKNAESISNQQKMFIIAAIVFGIIFIIGGIAI